MRLQPAAKQLAAALLPLTTHKRHRVRIAALQALGPLMHQVLRSWANTQERRPHQRVSRFITSLSSRRTWLTSSLSSLPGCP
jgi:hypothetical protein